MGILATLALVMLLGAPPAAAEVLSVVFGRGFIGTVGTATGKADSIHTFATLGIQRSYFIQQSTSNIFGGTQGNDYSGTLRLALTDGTTLDIPGAINWRITGPAGRLDAIGFIPSPTNAARTIAYGSGQSLTLDASSNYGLQPNNSPVSFFEGSSVSGNAATTGLLDSLNTYLAAARASAPAGPVTVTALTTSDTTPTLTGTAMLATGQSLSITVAGRTYSTTHGLSLSGSTWSLTIPAALPLGTYDVTATIIGSDGYTLADATAQELRIVAPISFVDASGAAVSSYAFSYLEASADADSLGQLRTSGGTPAFSIVANEQDSEGRPLFEVDTSTGAISLTAAGVASDANDFESGSTSHSLVLRASDGLTSADVPVTLTEANAPEGSLGGHVYRRGNRPESGVTVTLTGAGGVIGTALTDGAGGYRFTGLAAGAYSVQFSASSGKGVRGRSATGRPGSNEVTSIALDDEQVLQDVDGFVIDPSGVVYDAVNRQPLSGATITLLLSEGGALREVSNLYLDTTLGDANGKVTGSDGLYSFLLTDRAPSGRYHLRVEKAGYLFTSALIPPAQDAYVPGLGAGIEAIQTQSTAPQEGDDTSYHLAFDFTVTEGDPNATSNGVINNHIPIDPASVGLEVIKSTDTSALSPAAEVGDVLGYTVTVRNTGSLPLTGLTLEDTMLSGSGTPLTLSSGPTLQVAGGSTDDNELDAGEIWTYLATYVLTQADIDAGSVRNSATARATAPDGSPVEDVSDDGDTGPGDTGADATVTELAAQPGLALVKTAVLADDDGVAGPSVGDTITYGFRLTNTGRVTLTALELRDEAALVAG
ncbi:DUF7507 domain-containing protein, partial [Cereibacter sphaeroides]|uniref:DUF7507 domain-containing protein n=2 Tax=Cereibacter sphaeroides TaxID=1063 RepID=UPI001F2C8AEB